MVQLILIFISCGLLISCKSPVSESQSQISVSPAHLTVGENAQVTLQLRNDQNKPVSVEAGQVVFTLQGGTSAGDFGPIQSPTTGTYVASLKAKKAGTPANVTVAISGKNLTLNAASFLVEDFTPPPAPRRPLAPSNLKVQILSSSSVSLNWEDRSDNEERFSIQRSENGMNYAPVGTVPANTLQWSDAHLSKRTQYYYRLVAQNAAGDSDFSEVVTAIPMDPPPAPSHVNAVAGDGMIDLTWDIQIDANSFIVARSLQTGGPYEVIGQSVVAAFHDEQVQNKTQYFYVVWALNSAGQSPLSVETSARPDSKPLAPQNAMGRLTGDTSLHLSWENKADNALGLRVQRSVNNASFVEIATLPPTASEFDEANLTPNKTYAYRVQAWNQMGVSETSNIVSLTPVRTAEHKGWTILRATGPRTPAAQANDSFMSASTRPASVVLGWKPMATSSGTVSAYAVYRATEANKENFSQPVGVVAASALTLQYEDTNLEAQKTYFYVVRPIVEGQALPTSGQDTEVSLPVPPENMVLVHRWMANTEVCQEQFGHTPERNLNYSCQYLGRDGTADQRFDIGHHLFVDAYEMGCNWNSRGLADPTTGQNGDTYVRTDVRAGCFHNIGGTWKTVSELTQPNERQLAVSNKPGLPPVVRVTQEAAQRLCESQSVLLGTKRLPSLQEARLFSAWPQDIGGLTETSNPIAYHAAVEQIEYSASALSETRGCNTNSRQGALIEDLDNLANTLRTGSLSTSSCVSRYGVQDAVGNVRELANDVALCDFNVCTGQTSFYDANNSSLAGVVLTDEWGYGSGIAGFNDVLSEATVSHFWPTLGLPLVPNTSLLQGALAVGAATGQYSPLRFHQDMQVLPGVGVSSGRKAANYGGQWNSQASAGRYEMRFIDAANLLSNSIGFRCVVSVPSIQTAH